jgi:vitamin B12 transporter
MSQTQHLCRRGSGTNIVRRAFAMLPLGLATQVVLAQPEPAPRADAGTFVEDATEMAPIVVTATRTAETADDTLASVSVVDRAEMDRRQSRDVTDVLRGLPGVALSNSGGAGQPSSVFLRGTESDHTLVLIDGIKVGSATLGTTPWQNIPLDLLERVEVVRGPRSSLYGSEAIGGVIQMFTRGGEGGPLRPRLTVRAGTYGTAAASGGLSGGVTTDYGTGWLDGTIGFERTDGFDACRGEPFVGGCFVDEPDTDGYDNGYGLARAGWQFSDRLELSANFLRSEGSVDYDGDLFSGNRNDTVLQVASGRIVARPLAAWTSTLVFGQSRDYSKIYFDGAFLNRYDTRRAQLSWQNDIAFATDQLATFGVDYLDDRVDTKPVFDETSRDNTGVFGQYLGRFGAADLQLSLRHDENQQFGGHTTGNAGLGYRFGNGLAVTASFGTAFKAPTFNELYFPGFGNPELNPEQSRSGELGVSGPHPFGQWAVNAFQTEIDDLIAFDAATSAPENIDEARIRGVELWTTADVGGWLVDADVTLLDPVNQTSGPNKGNLLARRPEQTGRLDIARRFGRIGVGGGFFVAGRRFDDNANQVRLDGFTLVDLRAEYFFSESLRVQAQVANLFDESYETAAFYNQPGRTLMVTLRYDP